MNQKILDLLIETADHSNLTLDELVAFTNGMDLKAITTFCGNCASLPRYMKSNVTFNPSQRTIASSGNMRRCPDSQLMYLV